MIKISSVRARRSAKGFSLIEVLVSLAILSIFVVAVLAGLGTATKATSQSELRTRAMAEARSQVESIKSRPYLIAPSNDFAKYTFTSPSNNLQVFTLDRSNSVVSGYIGGIPWDLHSQTVSTNDGGVQMVTVIIKYNGGEVYRLVDFKIIQ